MKKDTKIKAVDKRVTQKPSKVLAKAMPIAPKTIVSASTTSIIQSTIKNKKS